MSMPQDLLSSLDLLGKLILSDKDYDSDKLSNWIKDSWSVSSAYKRTGVAPLTLRHFCSIHIPIIRASDIFGSGVFAEEQLHVFFRSADACDAEVFHQNLGHVGAKEVGQSGTHVDVLDAQVQQSQQHDDR